MFGGGQQTFQQVVDLLDQWRPEKAYRSERKYQQDLQGYLDEQLNSGGMGMLGAGMGGRDYVVRTEYGHVNADVAVDDAVGVELKYNLTNGQVKKLRGQIESYCDEFPYVIACACGVKDMDGWRELKNSYQGGGGGFGINQSQVALVLKRKDKAQSRQGGQQKESSSVSGFLDDFSLNF